MPTSSAKFLALAGTERRPLTGAKLLGPVNPQQRISVSVLVRSRRPLDPRRAPLRQCMLLSASERTYLTREELATRRGADASDLDRVEAFAHEHGLTVVYRSAGERRVVLSGSLGELTKAFGVRLQRATFQGREYRLRTGPVRVPASLAGIVEDVKGFDDRPQTQPHFRRLPPSPAARTKAGHIKARAATTSYTPPQIARLYNFPGGANGSGQCIALIELGGGYRTADLQTYFQGLKLPAPSVVAVGVDGGANTPGGDADGEVMLDIEVAAAVAPKAQIVVYFAPNTDQGFVDAIKTAVHDTVRKPSIISISWGGPEEDYTTQGLKNYDAVFAEAAALGVTILVASGDNGSADVNPPDKKQRVDFPSASPLVLSCGGTRLTTASGGTTIQSEVVWNDGAQGGASGGGVSTKYPLPTWQKAAKVPKLGTRTGRGVPDVAGNADPQTGYRVRVDGQNQVIGGTSAVAPLWAGLLALCNQRLGKPMGFLNATLYTDAAARADLHDITTGNNGAYQATAGWDACTGLGSPNGAALLTALGTRGNSSSQTSRR